VDMLDCRLASTC